MSTAYQKLLSYVQTTYALEQVQQVLAWDQETMMPAPAASQRATQLAALEETIHLRWVSNSLKQKLEEVQTDHINHLETSNYRHILKKYQQKTAVPTVLATELARASSICQSAWMQAKCSGEDAYYLRTLQQVVRLTQEKASCIEGFNTPYDALLDHFEPGETTESLHALFVPLEKGLRTLLRRIPIRDAPDASPISMDTNTQLIIAKQLAGIFGYQEKNGRIDLSTHPFCSGKLQDVRITTRSLNHDPFDCLFSTLHETGHAVYEQNINPSYAYTPNGEAVSMGVHESQSRLFENQLGKSQAFCTWLFHTLQHHHATGSLTSAQDLYQHLHAVWRNPIRTESDELHYNLHIIHRFNLEKALIDGSLNVRNIQDAWNQSFFKSFDYYPANKQQGYLQDPHWAAGAFGYFPTYALGNIYAGCLYRTLKQALPTLDDSLSRGNTHSIRNWLAQNIHRKGSTDRPKAIIEKACGETISEKPLLRYLEAKYLPR